MDLQFLRPLFECQGDVESVHLDTGRGAVDADKQIELRWRSARRTLAKQGAPTGSLAALDEVVGGARDVPGPQGEALFSSDGQVLGVHTMAEPPRSDSALHLPVADPLQLALDRDHQLAHVVVAVDREGADVDAYPAAATAPSFQRTFNGSTLHITRVRAGAVSHAAYHRRSVNLWSENTEQVAEDVRQAAEEVDAAVILIAGDPKAIGLLRQHLATAPPSGRIVYVEGGRTDQSAVDGLRASVDEAMHEAMVESHREVLDTLEAELAGGQALRGMNPVMEALSEGRVDTLLLAADRTGDPNLVASRRDPVPVVSDATALGDDATAFTAPASALLLRSAVHSNAQFTEILPDVSVEDGVAAIVRY
ncbi:hypothetical protein EIL87_18420 [Saccharopolyspora rhizosphaerae]|uniref:Peptide chain release factor 1 n=1 Tax=Saccharopolyspora rhizosphaerae TaxID=2492662 RepID=A0A426JNV1_9PSEU|nr:Vms1/Ankzf1 family peptidyl-tRNA hydrolase [Saccharopolyspora rhizosphaerae]RRO14720.1 hypothetical protein EIL87_18420 [Saccharopolyspora rhizosphaerae]